MHTLLGLLLAAAADWTAPTLSAAQGLSCWLKNIEDGPSFMLPLTNGQVSGMTASYHIDGRPIGSDTAPDFQASGPGPLGRFTGTLSTKTVIVLDSAVTPEAQYAHYSGTITSNGVTDMLLCYRY